MVEIAATGRDGSRARATGALLLALSAGALFYYKWGGALRVLRVNAHGMSADMLVRGGLVASTAYYLLKIWPALVFGLVLGAVVRATVSPRWVRSLLAGEGARPTVCGAIAGSPLMLCSCCVTPVFTGVWERGARLGASLAVMLASPGLNVAALALTFALFPLKMAVARVVSALVLVLFASHGVARALEHTVERAPAPARETDDDLPRDARAFAVRFLKSFAYLIAVTVPLILVGVVASELLLPHAVTLGTLGNLGAIAAVALVSMCVALPTFFEIPLALVLLQLGAPGGAAVALLIAGPIVNLPSLLVLGRETNVRVAAAVATSVFVVATVAGLVVG
jgi:uncharacterized membrane protein YraQ (UPF0718 family)